MTSSNTPGDELEDIYFQCVRKEVRFELSEGFGRAKQQGGPKEPILSQVSLCSAVLLQDRRGRGYGAEHGGRELEELRVLPGRSAAVWGIYESGGARSRLPWAAAKLERRQSLALAPRWAEATAQSRACRDVARRGGERGLPVPLECGAARVGRKCGVVAGPPGRLRDLDSYDMNSLVDSELYPILRYVKSVRKEASCDD
ncbi:hypothetical protein NDU88_011704 [Pleurodeles waltl]|uniref:Uncharacterized protein n=1 Tax=Pleurodeles waltl TaxID=8319 RepID=A0AAV7R0S2_PLEWA|nr:hypothetical protein NDU88_011704 [Pleurodeles waltl]